MRESVECGRLAHSSDGVKRSRLRTRGWRARRRACDAEERSSRRPVSVHLGAGTLLDVLVSVAQAHGALFWSTPDVTKAFAPGSLAFQTFDGRGASVAVTTGR